MNNSFNGGSDNLDKLRRGPMDFWRPRELGEIIAERELTIEFETNSRPVHIYIGRPVQNVSPMPDEPWWCPAQVLGLGPTEVVSIAGVDSLQALIGTLEHLCRLLPYYADKEGGKFGFPAKDERPLFIESFTIDRFAEAVAALINGLQNAVNLLCSESDTNSKNINRDRLCEELKELIKTKGFKQVP
jgi:hypothetical protein